MKFLDNKTALIVKYGRLQKITTAKVLVIASVSWNQKSNRVAKYSEFYEA